MKGLMIVLGTVLLLALLVVPSTPASASNTVCVSSPGSGPLGTTFRVTCAGFFPGEHVFAWLTEPDGHAYSGQAPLFNMVTNAADGSGNATVAVFSKRGDGAGIALGEWAVTIQGAATTGIGRFTVTGGTESVGGAALVGNSATGFVAGTGFLPGEVVSIWYDYPNGDCSGLWNPLAPMGFGVGLSTVPFGNVTASSSGSIGFFFGIFNSECRGTYHIVARGNSSGLGAETWLTTPNVDVATNASLVASPSTASARGGLIVFTGAGFAPGSTVSCWETSPQGQVLGGIGPFHTDSAGVFSFPFPTGSSFLIYESSEGALGQWAMSCRDGSGNTAIAYFWLNGNMVDP